ncbi:MAG TPA: oxalate/formate MFS antiporter [Chloroflexota bacterium]
MSRHRWVQLLVGILGMVMIANLQYGWTLFVNPIDQRYHWGRAAIQVAFSLFVLTETWLVPFEGYLVDRYGPRVLVGIGGVLVAIAWAINSVADSLTLLYAGGIVGGVGAGIVYGTSIGNALKWFPDRRGLAAGLTAAGFGAGSALTIIPISNVIRASGYEAAFLWFGLAQGLVVVVTALILRPPSEDELLATAAAARPRRDRVTAEPPRSPQPGRDYTVWEMVKTPVFWLLYVMFTMMATGGLMATAQLAPMATDYQVADIPVPILGITLVALQWALTLDRILNGLTRPFFGWVSDRLGRENTMALAFSLEGCAIALLLLTANVPLFFVLFSGLTFFAWGEIYSLFPAICGDLFGRRFATTNYGLLYTAKGTASLLVPIGSLLQAATGSWVPIFVVAIVFDFATAILALLVLKRVRVRLLAPAPAMASAAAGGSP